VDKDRSDEPRAVRALLFDLGGVVIGFDFNGAFRLWASRAGCDPTLIAERFSIDEAYEQHERGELPASRYFPALRESLDVDISVEELVEGWNDVYLGLVPGISEVLSAAATRWPLFAFTNSNPTHKSAWEHLYAGQLRSFREVFVSSDLGVRKPDPEAFQLVASLMGFEPEDILFFDDGAENVEGARAAGMTAVLVGSLEDVREALSKNGLTLGT
jgi:epoxide hydrolase-like predicted phosphatase